MTHYPWQNGLGKTYQKDDTQDKDTQLTGGKSGSGEVTNEYVLNVAFWTFLGFLLLEAVFALIANSQSMLEDAEAMSVDALTYLFNLCAERIKHRPYSEEEMKLPSDVREYKRELRRLYLEVVPPLISVATLIVVTGFAIRDAVTTLNQPDDVPEEDVDVNIMMMFSGANLILDIVNVTCFARAHQAFGLTTVRREVAPTRYSVRGSDIIAQLESQPLISDDASEDGETSIVGPLGAGEQLLVNLNMCSAWTVSHMQYLNAPFVRVIHIHPCFFDPFAFSAHMCRYLTEHRSSRGCEYIIHLAHFSLW